MVLIAGPCQIESRAHALEVAEALSSMARAADVPLIYKSSFDKANRTSISGARGVGMAKGLAILAEIRSRFAIPVLTDVHDVAQCKPASEAVDVLQIPAFLCRQTDLLLAAGETGAAVNVKKGQFLAPWDMANVAAKIASHRQRTHPAHRARRELRLQHAGERFPRPADHGRDRLSGRLRRHALGAAAGRPRNQHRAASGGSRRSSPAPPSPSASPHSSSKPTPIPTTRPRTGRT